MDRGQGAGAAIGARAGARAWAWSWAWSWRRHARHAALALALASVGTAAVALPAATPPAAAFIPYEAAIRDAAARHGVSADWLISVMLCESGGDPYAVNPQTGDSGLFQFNPSTWYSWGGGDIWDPYQQIELAAWAFSQGLSYHWLCA